MKKQTILYVLLALFLYFYYCAQYFCALFLLSLFFVLIKNNKENIRYISVIMKISIAIALMSRYPLMIYFYVYYMFQQIYKKKINQYVQDKIYSKVITIAHMILLYIPLSYFISGLIIDIMIMAVFLMILKYIYYTYFILRKKKPLIIHSSYIVGLSIIYVIVFAMVPYLKQPEISQDYKERFNVERFYQKSSSDRATILEHNDDALKERIRAIEHAKEHIIMSTFDFRNDVSGKQMLSSLLKASYRGVDIQILIDGFNGRLRLENDPYFYALATRYNVDIKMYNPISFVQPYKLMSRMHDKYIIIDDDLYILGGRNTFDYFLGKSSSYQNYDRDILVYNRHHENKSLNQIKSYFYKIWNQKESVDWKNKGFANIHCVKKANNHLLKIYDQTKKDNNNWYKAIDYNKMTVETDNITLLSNPTSLYSKEPTVFYSLTQLIKNSKEAIIHTPYVIANEMMYDSFKDMCKDSDVTLMTNSVLNNGNVFGAVDFALNKEKVLNTGLNVLEYNGGKSYHGKSIVIDDDISIIGSFNMDIKSVYQDSELMLVINSKGVNKELKENFKVYHQDSQKAVVKNNEIYDLYARSSMIGRIKYYIIKLFDPYVRYLF